MSDNSCVLSRALNLKLFGTTELSIQSTASVAVVCGACNRSRRLIVIPVCRAILPDRGAKFEAPHMLHAEGLGSALTSQCPDELSTDAQEHRVANSRPKSWLGAPTVKDLSESIGKAGCSFRSGVELFLLWGFGVGAATRSEPPPPYLHPSKGGSAASIQSWGLGKSGPQALKPRKGKLLGPRLSMRFGSAHRRTHGLTTSSQHDLANYFVVMRGSCESSARRRA